MEPSAMRAELADLDVPMAGREHPARPMSGRAARPPLRVAHAAGASARLVVTYGSSQVPGSCTSMGP